MRSDKFELNATLDHRKLFGFRNLAEAVTSPGSLEADADHLFQKRGVEAAGISRDPAVADAPLDHRKLFGFRNLADVAPAQDALEDAADHLFQKRGTETQ